MNAAIKAIKERYSCRSFTKEMPSDEILQLIAEATVQAPSAMNLQRWRAIVVKNAQLIADMEQEGLAQLQAMDDKSGYNRIMERGNGLFYGAPAMLVIPITPDGALDCGIAVENVAIAATSLGLGTLICGLAGLAFAGDKAAEFKARLGFPEGYEYGMAILLGYSEQQMPPHAPDLSKISFVE